MTIEQTNTFKFAEACVDENSLAELIDAARQSQPDTTDCKTWSITADQWRVSA